jgi:hypothetical protein
MNMPLLHWRAALPGGALRIALPAIDGDDAVGHALALAAAEPLLAALEAAFGHALDPHPAVPPPGEGEGDAADEDSSSLLWAPVHDAAAAPPLARVGLPLALLAGHRAAAALPLAWPAPACDVIVADYAELPPRGAGATLLLLPPAFEPAWTVRLQCGALGVDARAAWRGPGTPLAQARITPREAAAPAAPAAASVRLAEPTPVPLPLLLGWIEEGAAALGGRAVLADPAGRVLLEGEVLPLLQGAAFVPA